MSAHRTPSDRRPIYVSLGGVLVGSACLVLAFGTSPQNAAPIFNAQSAQATPAAAAPSASPTAPALIPLTAPIPTAGPTTAIAATADARPGPAAGTPYTPAYHSSLAAHAVSVTVPTPTVSPGASRQSAGGTSAGHVTTQPTSKPRPTGNPKPHPTPSHPTGSTGGSSGSGGSGGSGSNGNGSSQLPWWWWLVPHGPGTPTVPTVPTVPRVPTVPTVPTLPHFPLPTHTTDSGSSNHSGSHHDGSGFRHLGSR